MNDLIIVKQLPIIEERLKQISDDIDIKIAHAKSLVCNEDTVKEVKGLRADLTKEYNALEKQRKDVKTKVLKPYEQFETVYKKYVSDKFKNADADLKSKIDEVESGLKYEKRQEVKAYFDEYRDSRNIDFITFEQANINVTLSASMKSLKEQAKLFIDRICDDLALIDTQEHKEEILFEYKQHLNVSNAITTVTSRHKAIEDEKAKLQQQKQIKQAEEKAVEKVDEVLPAPEVEEAEYTLSFKVTATKDKLLALKQFLDDGGYKYE